MQLNLKYLFSFFAVIACFHLQAQVQFEVVVSSREMGRRDQLQVEYVISGAGKISDFELPYFEKWSVLTGPSTSSEMYTVNGKKSSTFKYIYVLSSTSTGKMEIPGTSVTADGKKIACKGTIVTVSKKDHVDGAGAVPSYATPPSDFSIDEDPVAEDFKEYELRPGEDPVKKIRKNLFVKSFPSKTKCFVGEPVLVTYKLYTRLRSTSRVVKQPTFTGCSVNEMTTTDMRPVVETVNGVKYNAYVFRRVQLFPLQAGRITSTMATVDNTVTFVSGGSDLRKLYYGIDAGQDYDLTLATEPINIEVLPLPGNKMAAVGNFEIFTRLKKDTIAANETNSLLVTVLGSGNFKSVAEPEINWPSNIYHFDPKETDDIDKLSFPLTGRRTYEIPFEVNGPGNIDFAPVSFSFFNPASKKFETAKSSSLRLMVMPAARANIQQSVLEATSGININYLLYLLGGVFVIGALFIWQRSKARLQPAVEIAEKPVIATTPLPLNAREKMDELLSIQDDAIFFGKARELAKEMIAAGKGNEDLLLQVMQDCNTVLYTPIPSTSRKEILDKLQKASV